MQKYNMVFFIQKCEFFTELDLQPKKAQHIRYGTLQIDGFALHL